MNKYQVIKKMSLDEMAEFLTALRVEIVTPIFEQMGYTEEQIKNLKIGVTAIMKNYLESDVTE